MSSGLQQRLIFSLLGACSVTGALAWGWGFTVDDALISTRIAEHLHAGAGYRFNLGGPVSDSVTPLGWAQLLSVLPGNDSWAKLESARWFGAVCTLLAGAMLGWALPGDRARPSWRTLALLLPVALSLPLGAWGQSGMETPLIVLLTTSTLLLLDMRRLTWSLLPATLASALRPELVPWTFVIALLLPASGPGLRTLRLALALSGPMLVAALRLWFFGSAAPLAIYAKPADSSLGFSYVLSALLLTGMPVLCVAGRSWLKVDKPVIAVGIACLAELAALVAAGGDWMALFRLFVPLLPACVWLGCKLVRVETSWWPLLARVGLACVPCGLLLATHLESTRSVFENRRRAIENLTPHLFGAERVGSLDVGWVGASTSASVVDFAGATDEQVAFLAGSHTSKKLPQDFLQRRELDALVLMLAPGESASRALETSWTRQRFARVAEQRVTQLSGADAFLPVAVIPFGRTRQGAEYNYLVLRRTSAFAQLLPAESAQGHHERHRTPYSKH